MSKSVGGFIQLIIPKEQMTWEEYKKKYGIDLDVYFEIVNAIVRFKPGVNKPILIYGYEEKTGGVSYGSLPNCGFMTFTSIYEDVDPKSLCLWFGDYNNSAFGVQLSADRKIATVEI